MRINIAKDFSPVPSGRYLADGPDSGERFRDDYLVPALAKGEDLDIEIDDAAGYGSSFLEEAFGGLIRVRGIRKEDALQRIHIISSDPEFEIYRELIIKFINEARLQ